MPVVRVLGPFQIESDREIELSRPSHRRLLSILALDAGKRIPRDVLIDRHWGENPPETARASLQTHIAAIRKELGNELIVTEAYGYRLAVDADALDSFRFEQLAEMAGKHATGGNWLEVVELADEALSYWRGPPFDEVRGDHFALPVINRLEELHMELVETRAHALLSLERFGEALPDLEALVLEHPLRERLWEYLMTARYALGRHAEALRAYREAESVFADIGVVPGAQLQQLEEKILSHDERLGRRPNNLPVELSDFVGRRREIEQAHKLISDRRLVTLTGPAGSGKTRLALRTAADVMTHFPDGVWFVELAPLRDPTLLPVELASAIGLKAERDDLVATLLSSLAHDRALIVFDNCEHLLDEAANLCGALLSAAPGLKIVVTSREPLQIPGETTYEVPPMSLPAEGLGRPDDALAFDAIRLFEQRASLVAPQFAITPDNVADVTDICRRLDGVPLAIELAAARTGQLAPSAMLERLDDRFLLLKGRPGIGPPRHETLEAAISWSYQLLSGDEKSVLNRLSVATGGFDLNLAEAICAFDLVDASDVVPIVADLVSKSLIATYDTTAGRRYRLLESVRLFARLRLEEADEGKEATRRHRHWCVGFAGKTVQRMIGGGRTKLLDAIQVEADNLLAAYSLSLSEDEVADASILAGAISFHWERLGFLNRTLDAAESALSHHPEPARGVYLRARYARWLFDSNQPGRALTEAQSACVAADELDSCPEKAYALRVLSHLHLLIAGENPADSLPLASSALEIAKATADPFAELRARRELGYVLARNGDSTGGLDELDNALEIAVETDDGAEILDTYGAFFDLLYVDPERRRTEPIRIARDMLSKFPEEHDIWLTHWALPWLPYIFCQIGDLERAERSVERLLTRREEGYHLAWQFMTQAELRWMQGHTGEALGFLRKMRRVGLVPRWYHAFYPLLGEILADLSRPEDVRTVADEYLETNVHRSEVSKKLGVLNPLVRAEVDAALSSNGSGNDQNAQRTLDLMRQLIETPSQAAASTASETPATHFAIASAELARLNGPSPDLWHEALRLADFAYTALYCRWRLAEAQLAGGDTEGGRGTLANVAEQANAMGANLIQRRAETVARRHELDLSELRGDRDDSKD